MLPMLRLAFCTVLSDYSGFGLRPLQCPRWQALSRLQAGQVSASRLVRSWWRCSRPRRIAARRRVMSYSPIHEKPVSGSRQKATGLPSGAREDLSMDDNTHIRSRFTRPISRTLLAAARKSIEPKPRYALCPSGSFVQVSDKDNGAPVRSATSARRRNMGAHFVCPVHVGLFAHVRLYWVKDNQPRPVLRDCLSMRSSERVSSRLASSITSTRSRSASASIKRGLTVSPSPSSAVW